LLRLESWASGGTAGEVLLSDALASR